GQRCQRPASLRPGEPRGDRQGPRGRRERPRQDGRAPGPEPPLAALPDRLPERVCLDRNDDRSRGFEDHRRLDRRADGGAMSPWSCSTHRGEARKDSPSSFSRRLPTAAIDAPGDRPYDPARSGLAWRPGRPASRTDSLRTVDGREVVTWEWLWDGS